MVDLVDIADAAVISAWKIALNFASMIPCDGSGLINRDCEPIEWAGVAATATKCGTATLSTDADFKVVGCFPTADCTSKGGLVPGATKAKYILDCGANTLLASAAAAMAIAYSM